MAVPDFQSFFRPLLEFASDGKEHSVAEARDALKQVMHVSEEDLKEITGVLGSKPSAQVTLAPGMLKSHYAPSKKMIIGEIAGLISKYGAEKIAILSFKNSFNEIRRDHQIQLSPKGSLREAAQNLFGSLRKLDAMDIRYIFAELVPEQGLGIAINDRLRRAASK